LAADDDVADDLTRAGHGAADAHRQSDDAPGTVANRGDAVERTLDAGPVVVAELTYVVGHMLQVGRRDRMVGQQHLAPGNARFRLAPEVEHDLEQLTGVGALVQGPRELSGSARAKSSTSS